MAEILAKADILSKASWHSITDETTITQRNVLCQEENAFLVGFFFPLVSNKKGKTVLHIKHKTHGEGIIFSYKHRITAGQHSEQLEPGHESDTFCQFMLLQEKNPTTFYFFW